MQGDPLLWLLALFSGVFLLSAAFKWLKLSRHRERIDQPPAIPVAAFRSAAGLTGFAFASLGLAFLWVAFTKL